MSLITTILENIFPLYIIVALGYIAGKYLDVQLPSLATVAIYILAPFINFGAMTKLEFSWSYIFLPLYIFAASTLIGVGFYRMSRQYWKNDYANLIAMSSVSGNTGYFGLPLILALFGAEWAGLYLFMNMATVLNEAGLGYYFGARGRGDFRSALRRVVRLPILYGVFLGLIANLLSFSMPNVMVRYWTFTSGAWIIIGMMLMGVALAKQDRIQIDQRLVGWLLFPKYVLWPLAGLIFVVFDHYISLRYNSTVHQMLLIFCSVPLAGNLVAFASHLQLYPEKVAPAVILSTILGMFTVPFILSAYKILLGVP